MVALTLRFHGRLNELLPAGARHRPIERAVDGSPTVKDVIESLGIPHVEVDVIVVAGVTVGFDHRVCHGDSVEVFPDASEVGDLTRVHRLKPPPVAPDQLRFVVDGHLGRLAAYLRMLGFDTSYSNHASDGALATLASREERTLLTRDRGLLKRAIVQRGYFVRSDHPHDQLREVVVRLGLGQACRLFGRCLRCNTLLEPIAPAAARTRVPQRVAVEQNEFQHCPACDGLYWRGSHHARMLRLIEAVVPDAVGR